MMDKEFLLVRQADNLIVCTVTRPDIDAGPTIPQALPPEGMDLIPSSGEFSTEGRRESERAYFVDGAVLWVDSTTLAELKAAKNEEINTKREALNTESFQFLGKAIRCKPLDRSDIDGTNGYVALFGEFPDGWQGGWKAADNTYVAIPTITEWKAFYKAMVDTGNANFRHAQQLKSLLAAAETPEQIAAIKWETPNVEP